jgi:hypothetical protein
MADKKFCPTPGPWEDEDGVLFNRQQGINICSVFPLNRKDNMALIKSAPTLYHKLKDTVEWLDVVIKTQHSYLGPESSGFLEQIEGLYDDLEGTLRQVEEE